MIRVKPIIVEKYILSPSIKWMKIKDINGLRYMKLPVLAKFFDFSKALNHMKKVMLISNKPT